MILIMNGNGTIAHKSGSTISGGVFTIVSLPSTNFKLSGAGIYRGPLKYTFSGGSAPGFDANSIGTTAAQTINPTAVTLTDDGLLAIRLGDGGTMTAEGTVSGTPTPITGPVEVSSAGQTKVSAD